MKVFGAGAHDVQVEAEKVGLATPGSNYSVHLLRGNYRGDGTLSEMCSNRTRDKSEKLHPEKFQLWVRKVQSESG